jgi:hypothetical protein
MRSEGAVVQISTKRHIVYKSNTLSLDTLAYAFLNPHIVVLSFCFPPVLSVVAGRVGPTESGCAILNFCLHGGRRGRGRLMSLKR